MKRAFLLLLIVVAAFAAISGTVAYFTDSVKSQNTVEAGNLDVHQHEYERIKAADGTYTTSLRRFTQGQMMYPGVTSTTLTRDTVRIGAYDVQMHNQSLANFVDKIVTAENSGSLPVYIRTFVAVPARYEGAAPVDWLHLDFNTSHGWELCAEPIRDQLIDGERYDIFYITNHNTLSPGDTSAPSLLGFYLDPFVTTQNNRYQFLHNGVRTDLGSAEELTILVTTVASQAQVFEGANGKTAAEVALDSTFGSPQNGCHPWTKVQIATDQQSLDALLSAATNETKIGLKNGAYTLPATLHNSICIFGMGTDVTLSAPALTGSNVQLDGVTFTSVFDFTGHGEFEGVTFLSGWRISPTTGPVLLTNCRYDATAATTGSGSYTITTTDCQGLNP